jgi:hypothetical protein
MDLVSNLPEGWSLITNKDGTNEHYLNTLDGTYQKDLPTTEATVRLTEKELLYRSLNQLIPLDLTLQNGIKVKTTTINNLDLIVPQEALDHQNAANLPGNTLSGANGVLYFKARGKGYYYSIDDHTWPFNETKEEIKQKARGEWADVEYFPQAGGYRKSKKKKSKRKSKRKSKKRSYRKNKSKRISRKSRRSFIKKTRNKKSKGKRMVGGGIRKKRYEVFKPDKLYLDYSHGWRGITSAPGLELKIGDKIIAKDLISPILSLGKKYLPVFSINGLEQSKELYCDLESLKIPSYEYKGKKINSTGDFVSSANLSGEIKIILEREEIELNELEFIDVNRLFKIDGRGIISRELHNLKPVTDVITPPEHVAPLETRGQSRGGSEEVRSDQERFKEALTNLMKPIKEGGLGLSPEDVKKYWRVVKANNGGRMIPGPEMISAIAEEYFKAKEATSAEGGTEMGDFESYVGFPDGDEGSETLLDPVHQLMERNREINRETAKKLIMIAGGDVEMALELYNSDLQARASARDLQARAAPGSSTTQDEELDLYSD